MAFHVGHRDDVELLLGFLQCQSFIAAGRAQYQYIGDQMLPARSALEFVLAELTNKDRAIIAAWDDFARAHADAFNVFFAAEHYLPQRATALENWVWDDHGATPPVPTDHWWWAPIAPSGEE